MTNYRSLYNHDETKKGVHCPLILRFNREHGNYPSQFGKIGGWQGTYNDVIDAVNHLTHLNE